MEANEYAAAPEIVEIVSTLPRRARLLFKILCRRCGGKPKCWPSLGVLSEEMGLESRTVERWLKCLNDAMVIEIERTGRSNSYWIPPRENRQVRPDKPAGQTRQTGRSDPTNRQVRPDKPAGLLEEKEVEVIAAVAASAAAANAPEEKTIKALKEIGMPSTVEEIAANDISLAVAVLSHANWRLANGKKTNWPGYLHDCFTNPEKFGFTRDDAGAWSPPKGENMAAVAQRQEDRRAKHAKQLGDRIKEKEEWEKELVLQNHRIAVWEAKSNDIKEKIRRHIREREPLWATMGDDSYCFRTRCMALAEQWEREGKL